MISLEQLIKNDGAVCLECGIRHFAALKYCKIKQGAINYIPDLTREYGGKPYILCDINTYKAAGEKVCSLLKKENIEYVLHILDSKYPSPNEQTVGEALMWFDADCTLIIGIGGGVINDTCKIISAVSKLPYIMCATAPSMDGFASTTSSMDRNGLKVSMKSKCPDAVIGDLDILSKAPKKLILSGIGDMLAKYVSLTEWKAARLIIGEYYCPHISTLVKTALDECAANGKKAVECDIPSCEKVMNGLVLAGLGMNYTKMSRPASGMEHYISHILDMKALEFGKRSEYHGIQCALGTLMTIKAYECLSKRKFDREKAIEYVSSFSLDNWFEHLKKELGHSANAIIEGELREKKYDREKHSARLETILSHETELRSIISELPSSNELERFMREIGLPTKAADIGLSREELREAFILAKDVRDKYVLGRLLWDLGLIEEIASEVATEF